MNQVIQPPIPTPLTPPIDPSQDRAKQLEEIVRCKSDPIYFMLNYVYIRRPGRGGGRIRFKMYDFQKESIMNFLKHRKVIILKSRQLGISWTYAAYVAWKILFHEAQDVLLVAQNGSVATNLMGRIKFIMKYLPKWMVPENKKVMPVQNRQSIELFNDSKVMATTTTANSGVGESLSLLIIDEAAVIPHAKAKDLWTAIEPTIEVGGDVIIVSTPREVGAWFHEMWVDACKDRKTSKVTGEKTTGKNGFFPMILGWEVLPDRTQEWAKRKISEIGTQRFRREYACQFIGHGSTLIEYDIIDQMEKLYCVAPIRHETNPLYPDSPIKIWKDPEPGSKYVMFIDTSRSEAEGGDDQAFSIFEFPDASGEDDAFVKYEQVVEFNGKMLLNDYSEVLYEFAVAYNKAFVVCEKNAMGIKIATDFSAEYYPFIWYDMEPQSKMNRSAKQRYKKEPGLDTTTRTRDLYVKLLYNDFMKQKIVIRGRTSYEQLRHFVWNAKKRRYEAMSGKHDDLVMVLGMAAYVWYNATHFDRGNRLIIDFIRSGGLKYTHSGKKKGNYDIPIMVHRSTSKKMGNPNDPIHIQQNDFGWLFGGSAKWYKQRDD
jgi:hypothetical protein